MPPYLPPVRSTATAPVPDLGFMTLPIEGTAGGFRNNIFDPGSTPFPGGEAGPALGGMQFNPFLQGYMSGGKWNPYLPGKIILGQRKSSPVAGSASSTPTVGQASQWVNGKEYNVNGNNYAAGTDAPAPYKFGTAPGDARESAAAPFTGFGFGQEGQQGYKWLPGEFSSQTPGTSSKFFSAQPAALTQAPNPLLGTLQPWQDPRLKALQQSRSQP